MRIHTRVRSFKLRAAEPPADEGCCVGHPDETDNVEDDVQVVCIHDHGLAEDGDHVCYPECCLDIGPDHEYVRNEVEPFVFDLALGSAFWVCDVDVAVGG